MLHRTNHRTVTPALVRTAAAVGIVLSMAGCARLMRYEGTDAALLRVTVMTGGGVFSMRPVNEGRSCGERMVVGGLKPAEPDRKPGSAGYMDPSVFPREGMLDSPPATDTRSYEARVKAGLWQVGLTASTPSGAGAYQMCSVLFETLLEARRQHWVQFEIDPAAKRCTGRLLRVTGEGATAQWVAHAHREASACAA